MISLHPGGPLRGTLRLPGDKSITHRALLFNALAEGEAQVVGALDGEDCRSTAACLRALGVEVEWGLDRVHLKGRPEGLREPTHVLDCGNSGTTMRLLLGILAAQDLYAVLDGDASLRSRPMARVVRPLNGLGAHIDGRRSGDLAPLSVRGGPLRGGVLETPLASAQVKTALLLAGLRSRDGLQLRAPPSRDHSERLLRAMGVQVQEAPGWLSLAPGQTLRAVDVRVPGDISSATFWLVAASLVPGSEMLLQEVGVNPSRTGALEVLLEMGADIHLENSRDVAGEPVADLRVRHAPLRAFEISGERIASLIDELPVLCLAGALSQGSSMLRDAQELRHKESDRIESTARLLRSLGVPVEVFPDGLRVHGVEELRGAALNAANDHRIAMTAMIAAHCARGSSSLIGAESQAVSYPGFRETLVRLSGGASEPA
jgi:3-phosphoshikimate 1-carboxyvinyltransferase